MAQEEQQRQDPCRSGCLHTAQSHPQPLVHSLHLLSLHWTTMSCRLRLLCLVCWSSAVRNGHPPLLLAFGCMLKDGGVDVAVSEKRMKRIKAWAVADALVSGGPDASCSTVAASYCAHCGKTASELGAGEKLRKCGGCGVARYCSGACQKSAWSAGHKKECGSG